MKKWHPCEKTQNGEVQHLRPLWTSLSRIQVFTPKICQKNICFFINNSVSAVHPELNGFDGAYFGGHPHGIHLAVGPDRMHLLYEGIGMAIIGWTTIVITKAGISCE